MPFKVPCPECKQSVEFKVERCPYCTIPLISGWKQHDTWKLFFKGIILGLFILPIISLLAYIFENDSKTGTAILGMYFSDLWWWGWIVMPLGGGMGVLWIITYIRRN